MSKTDSLFPLLLLLLLRFLYLLLCFQEQSDYKLYPERKLLRHTAERDAANNCFHSRLICKSSSRLSERKFPKAQKVTTSFVPKTRFNSRSHETKWYLADKEQHLLRWRAWARRRCCCDINQMLHSQTLPHDETAARRFCAIWDSFVDFTNMVIIRKPDFYSVFISFCFWITLGSSAAECSTFITSESLTVPVRRLLLSTWRSLQTAVMILHLRFNTHVLIWFVGNKKILMTAVWIKHL